MKKSTKKVKESTAASRQTEDGAIKEITPKKRKKGRYILIYLAIIGFVFYAVITIINQNVQIAEKKGFQADEETHQNFFQSGPRGQPDRRDRGPLPRRVLCLHL